MPRRTGLKKMCQNTKFPSKKGQLLLLLELGMPALVIQKVLNIYPYILWGYMEKLKNEGKFIGAIAPAKHVKPISLKLLADLKNSPEKFDLPKKFTTKLMAVLTDIIEEKEILRIMRYSLPAILSFQEIRYSEDVPSVYKKLIEDVYGDSLGLKEGIFKDYDFSSSEWEKYLTGISSGEITMPTTFSWKTGHFVQDILENIANKSREAIAPLITRHLCKLLDGAINELLEKQKEFLTKYYGLAETSDSFNIKESAATLMRSMKIKKERVRQLRKSYLRCLREVLGPYYLCAPSWENVLNLKKGYEVKISDIKNAGAKRYAKALTQNDQAPKAFRHNLSIETENFLLAPIDQLGCSARTYNILKMKNINYVYELAEYTEKQVQRWPRNGTKSHKEISEILTTNNLCFGMRWTNSEVEYFESIRRGR